MLTGMCMFTALIFNAEAHGSDAKLHNHFIKFSVYFIIILFIVGPFVALFNNLTAN